MKVLVTDCFADQSDGLQVPEKLFRQLRRADDFTRLSVVAAHTVLQGIGDRQSFPEHRTGLFLGTAFGPMQTNFEVLDQVVEREPVSPTLFSHSVFNSAAGYIASVLDIRGCAVTLTDFSFPFFRAVCQGLLAIKTNHLDRCLVMQVETYSELLKDARRIHDPLGREWERGVSCWLLERQSLEMVDGYILDGVEIISKNDVSADWELLREQVILAGKRVDTVGFLGAAIWITSQMAEKASSLGDLCVVDSLYGRVKIDLKLQEGE